MARSVLSLNAGSSGIKLGLFEADGDGTLASIARGSLTGLTAMPHLTILSANGDVISERVWERGVKPPFEAVFEEILRFAGEALGPDTLAVVGHRVTHGGAAHTQPERVSPVLMSSLEALIPLAPWHQPPSLEPIRAVTALRPGLPQVACFDTGFHQTIPILHTRLALPRELFDEGIKRYGFHGLSFEYIAEIAQDTSARLAHGRTIVAHLGSSASLCAMHGGRSLDVSMGFSPLDGLMMATRCGTIDPGIVLYLQQQRGMSLTEVEDLLHRQSGLLGASGCSADMKDLLDSSDPRAAEAISLFVLRVVRETGALSAVMGGVDGFVFTAGVGENSPAIRKAICDRLGLTVDGRKNAQGVGLISAAGSPVDIWVIPTDEEAMIARHAVLVLDRQPAAQAKAPAKKRRRRLRLF